MADALTRFGVTYAEVAQPQTLTQGDGDTLENDIVLTDEEQYLVLAVTLTQYTKLLSAALNGANRHWPQEYIEVIYPLIKAGKIVLCEAVAECFESSETFQQALQNYLDVNGYGSGTGTPGTPSAYNTNDLMIDGSLITGCDNDALFGAITQLVDLMNDTITDLLEFIVAESVGVKNTSIAIDAIPLLSELPFDELLDFVNQLAYTMKVYYAAEYTATLRDDIRCDLFCLTINTCQLDFQTWADYFLQQMGESVDQVGWVDAVGWFVNGTFTSSAIVYAMHAILAQTLAYGAKFLDLDMAWLSRALTSALNDPDSDWQTICTECPGEYPTLVIGDELTSCDLSSEDGGTLTDLSDGYWRLEATPISNQDWWGVFQEENGNKFMLQEVVRTQGLQPYRRYCDGNGNITAGVFADPPENVHMYSYRFGKDGGVQIIYEFRAVWPT